MSRLHQCLFLTICLTLSVGQPATGQPRAEEGKRSDGKQSAATDLYGDPLPEEAIVRFGTLRLRHSDEVLSLAYSPDGKLIASGGRDNTVSLWDSNTGKESGRLLCPQRWLDGLAFSPGGKLLAAASSANEVVQVWDTAERKRLFQLRGSCVVFSPDGKTLATGCKDKAIRFWDPGTGKELRQSGGHQGEVRCLAYSSDGRMLASGSRDGTARLWSVATGRTIHQWKDHQNGVHSIAFGADGNPLALGSNGMVLIYDPATGKRIRELGPSKQEYGALLFSTDGATLATAFYGGIRLWDSVTGKKMRDLIPESADFRDEVTCLAFAPDGKQLISASRGQRICQWDLATGREVLFPNSHLESIRDVAVSPDGKTIATASTDKTVRLWAAATGKEVFVLRGHKYGVHHVDFSPDGRILASTGSDDMVIVWDRATGKELRRMPGLCLAFSPDGILLAAGGHDRESEGVYGAGIVHLYDPATGKEIRRLSGHHRKIESVVFSPDGRTLATIEDEPFPIPSGLRKPPTQEPSSVRLWDVATGREWLNFGAGRAAAPIVFSADGKTLVSSSHDHSRLHFWEVATGMARHQITGQLHSFWHVAFATDDRTFVTAGSEPNVRVREWPSGREIGSLEGHRGSVYALAFAPDGKAMVSGGPDTTAVLWNLTNLKRPAREPVKELTREQLQASWETLGRENGEAAHQVIGSLLAARGQSVAYLKELLKPASIDREHLAKLIADLDNERFAVREEAGRALTESGEVAAPFLHQALKAPPSAEAQRRMEKLLTKAMRGPLPPLQVRQLRAVEVLEYLGTTEARQVLESLSKGDSEARLTREAKAALERLGRRSGP